MGSHIGWVTQTGPLKILIPLGGLALSFVDPGTEVLVCAELNWRSDPEIHANNDVSPQMPVHNYGEPQLFQQQLSGSLLAGMRATGKLSILGAVLVNKKSEQMELDNLGEPTMHSTL